MDRVILHSDINACYANVELLFRPELCGKPVAVGGDEERRHGIILSKTEEAKRAGVKTAMTLWQARQCCPELIVLPPNFDRYLYFAREVSAIYADYTDKREPFGMDESWLDLTGCVAVRDGLSAAEEISRRVKNELGLTVSIGVSWNKVFAKLGSDHKKPDAVTVFDRENYRDLIWPKSVRELLYVGPATAKKLAVLGIHTIGELALADEQMLRLRLGKAGTTLHNYANGMDADPVLRVGELPPAKSIGNGTTTCRDMKSAEDALPVIMSLAESVGVRLRSAGVLANSLTLELRTAELSWSSHGRQLHHPTDCDRELLDMGMELLAESHRWPAPLRSLSLRAERLIPIETPEQIDFFTDYKKQKTRRSLDATVDRLRGKYGATAVRRGAIFTAPEMAVSPAQQDYTFVKSLETH